MIKISADEHFATSQKHVLTKLNELLVRCRLTRLLRACPLLSASKSLQRTLVNIVKQDLQAAPVQQRDVSTKLDRSGRMLGRTSFQISVVLARRTSFLDKTLLKHLAA